MSRAVIDGARQRMEKAVQNFERELGGVRAGRATPALLERVRVQAYGSELPVQQVASIHVPDARTLVIQPWDKGLVTAVERAILKSDLGLNPSSDGQVIRLVIPPMTEQRRTELVRQVRKMAEEARVAVRNIRREANEQLKAEMKAEALSEDQERREQEEVQRLTDRFVQAIDEALAAKEKEIMEV
ncbi:MAG: ribosome recycling factor [Clostridia bacterium]|nr:ribosome recycling factor [Clostridia bacterium]MCL6520979.1 ribosome recycling factor [Bacillota bacterium]